MNPNRAKLNWSQDELCIKILFCCFGFNYSQFTISSYFLLCSRFSCPLFLSLIFNPIWRGSCSTLPLLIILFIKELRKWRNLTFCKLTIVLFRLDLNEFCKLEVGRSWTLCFVCVILAMRIRTVYILQNAHWLLSVRSKKYLELIYKTFLDPIASRS